ISYNMQAKPEIVFTFPASIGGVSSFNYNIINHSKLIKQFHSKVILLREASDKRPFFLDAFNVDEVITFNFSDQENQYHLQKRLSKLLGTSNGAIVTDNGLTIEAAARFNSPKTIFHLIHDYYYVNQSIKLGDLIDVVIAHSSFFSDAVFASNPALFANRSFYIPYGVQQLPAFLQKKEGLLNLVFLGRLDDGKGVMKLYEIDKVLKENNVQANWSVIGKGALKESLRQQWKNNQNISFYEPDTTREVYELLGWQDVFVFPTIFEGTPVSILECLANGIVTITNNLPGGIRDIITDGIGYRCSLNDIEEFAFHITTLHNDRTLLKKMQHNCFELANKSYNIEKNADNYFTLFLQFDELKRAAKTKPRNLYKLDKEIYPNSLVKLIRGLK
ncbi:MAG: glycosyltransferase, partial [Segetibacter sp.]|nr:glycosyltransferase [Segetibacter sp.]